MDAEGERATDTDPDGQEHDGGGFNPPVPTNRGGPDYGRFVEAVRTLQDLTRGADAPDEVVTEAADLIERVNGLLAPVRGRRMARAVGPAHGPAQPRQHPVGTRSTCTSPRTAGSAAPRGSGASTWAATAPCTAERSRMLFDSLLGFTAFKLSESKKQRTAFLHVNYRKIVPIGKELQVEPESTASRAARSSSPAGCATATTCCAMPRRCS